MATVSAACLPGCDAVACMCMNLFVKDTFIYIQAKKDK